MLSFRPLARAAPRAVNLVSSRAIQPMSALSRTAMSSMRLSQVTAPRAITGALFSTSTKRFSGNSELIAMLQSEIKTEKDLLPESGAVAADNTFLEEGGWQVHDALGEQEVKLTRKYNDETVEISFSVDPMMMEQDPEADEYDNEALEDMEEEEAIVEQPAKQKKGKKGKQAVPEPPAEEEEDEMEFDEDEEVPGMAGSSMTFTVRITKESKPGILEIDVNCQFGEIFIEGVAYYPSVESQTALTRGRSLVYTGPTYSTLDPRLQDLMEAFVRDRGVNENFTLWLPEFVNQKEQREYVNWLKNVKSFLS